jgi:hypothetical protein
MHYPAAVTLLVGSVPLLCEVAGIVGALLWRRRAVRRGLRVTVVRSAIAVFNGLLLGIVAGAALYLLLAAALPAPA